MQLKIYQVDAFTDTLFRGNPAAIIPLPDWLADETLQSIAMENNLSETAFLVQSAEDYALRWFTPTVEVDLCGHATLAAAHVLFEHLGHRGSSIKFQTRSGELTVERASGLLRMDFPALSCRPVAVDDAVSHALGERAQEAAMPESNPWQLLYRFEAERQIAGLAPDFKALAEATDCCVICTAPGDEVDIVSRFFCPRKGIDEDPVTGSAHCLLTPFWAAKLHRPVLRARQLSPRGGELLCEWRSDRVLLSGSAVTFLQGTIQL